MRCAEFHTSKSSQLKDESTRKNWKELVTVKQVPVIYQQFMPVSTDSGIYAGNFSRLDPNKAQPWKDTHHPAQILSRVTPENAIFPKSPRHQSLQEPPMRAAPRTDPDLQSYRIRLLLRVFGIEASRSTSCWCIVTPSIPGCGHTFECGRALSKCPGRGSLRRVSLSRSSFLRSLRSGQGSALVREFPGYYTNSDNRVGASEGAISQLIG